MCVSGIGIGVLRITTKIVACLRVFIGIREPLRVLAWQIFSRDVSDAAAAYDDDKY
jgi:hypothetical protein